LTFIYDAGALIAAERGSREFAELHEVTLECNELPLVPAGVFAQVWAGGPRQALLARVLKGCQIEPLDAARARIIGRLRVKSGLSDVIDISVVEAAIRKRYTIVTSDSKDIAAVIDATGIFVPVLQI
jgi:predicted nucleic acid-binding protein